MHLHLRLLAAVTVAISCTKSTPSLSPSAPIDAQTTVYESRDEALADYTTNYLGSSLNGVTWNGDVENCDAGTTSAEDKALTLQRLNYFRRLSGLPDGVTLVDSLNDKAQQAALMMKANNQLNHYPDPGWHCFSPMGQLAAARSNLALGVTGPDAVTAYMQDAGLTNVGHRRWVLFPSLTKAGTGDTDFSNALWLIGDFGNRPALPFVAYPGNGFIPSPLVFPYWSFSVEAADFSQATIQVTGPSGESRSVSVFTPEMGCGDNTLVWNMNDLNTDTLTADRSFRVNVSHVLVGGQPKDYQYTVSIVAVAVR
ncbi:MAG TPA: CAP domain-containing protein [Dinghuibacter sp.]|jgi:hypothetical protein|uniref:CAP domain-containing protein n=1 Tax=Dinghuibacter sp. TaxID=2024697 RepID=UPI002BCA4D26|nr:CAP domain-containing protein [Dinghuibacter sp.]HTJ15080.1 CAP domain-containing protein [Dinghuibacter sp.]